MEIDFKVYGDDDQEILITGADTSNIVTDNGVFGTTTTVSPYNGTVAAIGQNVASTKKLVGDTTVVPLTDRMLDSITKGYIYAKWGTESQIGNVKFQGTVGALPDNPKHGWLVYMNNHFHIYDESAKKWRAWACTS